MDDTSCNYNPLATSDDGSCTELDECGTCGGAGIPEGECDCEGTVLDECGVCGGPGPTEVVIESITILYDSLYAEQIDNWFVFEVGADTVFNYTCEPVFTGCGDLVSHEGYDYSTVLIGDRCWFSENCRYLPVVSSSSTSSGGGSSENSPYFYVYGYEGTDASAAMATENYDTYGVLYNWPAVMTEAICPSGWHIPSDGEFTQLTDFLGGANIAGEQMKSTSGWNNNGNGSNSSGFEGLPGGYNWSNGLIDIGYNATWWSSSASNSSEAWQRRLYGDVDNVNRFSDHRHNGFSARCVIDYTDECGVLNGDNSTCSDECGVPNGNNSTCLDECGVLNGDNSSCADCAGVANGDSTTDECGTCDNDPSNDCPDCGDLVSHEGYDYSTVLIGDQCWFSENCRYLPEVSPSTEESDTDPYYYVYGYEGMDVADAKATTNYDTYGVLYNWPAVMTEGICPSGWHIPSDGEWQTMEISLGMSEADATSDGWRGSPVGDSMKSTSGWFNNGNVFVNGSNSSGFTGLPGGYSDSGVFNFNGVYGVWWSASESGSNSWQRALGSSYDNVGRNVSGRYSGFSARCVKDQS